jgi:hypothetical protein
VVVEALRAGQHKIVYCEVLRVRKTRYYFKRITPKSPTGAELLGLTDNIGLVELFQEFMVVSLVTIGGGIARTKHL